MCSDLNSFSSIIKLGFEIFFSPSFLGSVLRPFFFSSRLGFAALFLPLEAGFAAPFLSLWVRFCSPFSSWCWVRFLMPRWVHIRCLEIWSLMVDDLAQGTSHYQERNG
jgi:hypothetical protein